MLADVCEGSLRESFISFYETMDEERCKIEPVNLNSDRIIEDIKVLNYC